MDLNLAARSGSDPINEFITNIPVLTLVFAGLQIQKEVNHEKRKIHESNLRQCNLILQRIGSKTNEN